MTGMSAKADAFSLVGAVLNLLRAFNAGRVIICKMDSSALSFALSVTALKQHRRKYIPVGIAACMQWGPLQHY